MNKKNILFILVLSFMLIVSFMFTNINNKINNCENLIIKFFQLYSENNYNEMKKLTCNEFNKLYLNNLENGIFGIKDIKYIELENYYENEKNKIIFKCNVIMEPAKISVYSNSDTETSFYLELHNINKKWKLCKYYTNY